MFYNASNLDAMPCCRAHSGGVGPSTYVRPRRRGGRTEAAERFIRPCPCGGETERERGPGRRVTGSSAHAGARRATWRRAGTAPSVHPRVRGRDFSRKIHGRTENRQKMPSDTSTGVSVRIYDSSARAIARMRVWMEAWAARRQSLRLTHPSVRRTTGQTGPPCPLGPPCAGGKRRRVVNS